MKYTLCVLLFVSVTATAHAEVVEYSDPELHYSIRIPEGWGRLPPNIADQAVETFAHLAGASAPKYQAWFQRSDRPPTAYPYFLVSRQVCRMPTLGELAAGLKQSPEAAAERANKLNGVMSDYKVSDPVIDTRRNMVVVETEQTVNLGDAGKVYGKCCLFPGKMGVAQLYFYTTPDDRSGSRAEFDRVLSSFAFEPGYDYESGLAANAPGRGFDSSRMLWFAAAGGLFGPFCYRLLKRINPNSPPGLLRLRTVFAMLILLGAVEFLLDPTGGPFTLTLVLGSIAVGTFGLAVSWIVLGKHPPSPAGEGPTAAPPA